MKDPRRGRAYRFGVAVVWTGEGLAKDALLSAVAADRADAASSTGGHGGRGYTQQVQQGGLTGAAIS